MDTSMLLAIASIFTSVMIPLIAMRNKATQEQIEILAKENARLADRLAQEEGKTSKRDTRIEEVLEQNRVLAEKLEQALDRVHVLENENAKLSNDLEGALGRVKILEDDNTALQETVAKLVEQMKEAGVEPKYHPRRK